MLTSTQKSLLRAVIRSVLVLVTAFGLSLSPEQVAVIQLAFESVLVAAVQWNSKTPADA